MTLQTEVIDIIFPLNSALAELEALENTTFRDDPQDNHTQNCVLPVDQTKEELKEGKQKKEKKKRSLR